MIVLSPYPIWLYARRTYIYYYVALLLKRQVLSYGHRLRIVVNPVAAVHIDWNTKKL